MLSIHALFLCRQMCSFIMFRVDHIVYIWCLHICTVYSDVPVRRIFIRYGTVQSCIINGKKHMVKTEQGRLTVFCLVHGTRRSWVQDPVRIAFLLFHPNCVPCFPLRECILVTHQRCVRRNICRFGQNHIYICIYIYIYTVYIRYVGSLIIRSDTVQTYN